MKRPNCASMRSASFIGCVLWLASLAHLDKAAAKTALADPSSEVPTIENWRPSRALYWLSANHLDWIAGRQGSSGGEDTLLSWTKKDGTRRLKDLVHFPPCLEPSQTSLLVDIKGPAGTSKEYRLSVPGVIRLEPVEKDSLKTCQTRFTALFQLNRFVTLADSEFNTVGIRRSVGGRPPHFAILDANHVETIRTLDPDISLDSPPLAFQRFGNQYIAYPHYSFDRRRALGKQLPGIPVFSIGPDTNVNVTWVPWTPWSTVGAYDFALSRTGLIASVTQGLRKTAPESGIYTAKDGWSQLRSADVTPSTLRLSHDGCRIAWREIDRQNRPSIRVAELC